MQIDGTLIIVLVAVVASVAVLVGWWIARRRRSNTLQKEFGPEYDHEVQAAGSRKAAEDELQARRERVSSYDLKTLPPEERRLFTARWVEVQKGFVDHPSQAVEEASLLVDDAMRARGYPLGEIQEREADLSVKYPREVQDYRAAHRIAERNRRGEATTEELREATIHYRNLFEHLVGLEPTTHAREESA